MGEYREKLMGASIAHYKGRKHLERVSPLAHSGAVSNKQLLEAEAEVNATRATLQSLLEQLQQDTHQTSLASKQAVKELETRVSVHETNLRILGFADDAISGIDRHRQGEAICGFYRALRNCGDEWSRAYRAHPAFETARSGPAAGRCGRVD